MFSVHNQQANERMIRYPYVVIVVVGFICIKKRFCKYQAQVRVIVVEKECILFIYCVLTLSPLQKPNNHANKNEIKR